MNTCSVSPCSLSGTLTIPPSKSHTLRAILFGALAEGVSEIFSYLPSPDMDAMVRACRAFGAHILILENKIYIEGVGGKIAYAEDVIDAGNSGIVLRFCSAVGALASKPVVITGDHSIKYKRPMEQLLHGLHQLGVRASSMRGDGYAPVIIEGPVTKREVFITGEDSQPVSALLILAALLEGKTTIHVKNPGEKPWVSLTLSWLDQLGVSYKNYNFTKYVVTGKEKWNGFTYTVPGDFSSAAFPLIGALICNTELTLENLDIYDAQGDKEFLYILQQMGANIVIDPEKKRVILRRGGKLKGLCIDVNDCIDVVPALAAVAMYAEGVTEIKGASIARHKESNRLEVITKELQKMGGEIKETEDGLWIRGSPLFGATVHSHFDHRIAMSLIMAALGAKGKTKVTGCASIQKTYPSFFIDVKALGGVLEYESS